MSRKLDSVLIIDIESTCWEQDTPKEQMSEIIEVGVCILNVSTLNIEDNFNLIVKPQKSKISSFCTKLTGWTQNKVDKGISLSEACDILCKQYKSSKRTWASYGDYDRKQFERQCRDPEYGAKYPFGPTHLNIKNLFALKHKLPKEVGMDKALNLIGLQLEGIHHNGKDDAINISKILKYCLKNH